MFTHLSKPMIVFFMCACTFLSKGYAMEYEVQLTKTSSHLHHHHKHHLSPRIILGPQNAPEGIIEFSGHKEMSPDVKAEFDEVQVINLEHNDFKSIFDALIQGATVSVSWDEINDVAMLNIRSTN